jgi:asparagine synthetase A
MDEQLELKRMERNLLDNEITLMLLKLGKEILDSVSNEGKVPDYDAWSRRIVAHVREQLK